MCYIEFGDEEGMRAGLTKGGQVSKVREDRSPLDLTIFISYRLSTTAFRK